MKELPTTNSSKYPQLFRFITQLVSTIPLDNIALTCYSYFADTQEVISRLYEEIVQVL